MPRRDNQFNLAYITKTSKPYPFFNKDQNATISPRKTPNSHNKASQNHLQEPLRNPLTKVTPQHTNQRGST